MSALRERFFALQDMGGYWRFLHTFNLQASLPVRKKLVPISLLGDKEGGCMLDCMGGCQKSFYLRDRRWRLL